MNFSNPVASIPYVGRYTWATLPSASAAGAGATAQVTGFTPATVLMISDGTYWKVVAPTAIYFDSTQVTGDLTGADQILKQVLLPAGILRACSFFEFITVYGKDGTTDAATANRLRLGSAGTTADAVALVSTALISGARSGSAGVRYSVASSTVINVASSPAHSVGLYAGSSGTSVVWPNAVTVPNIDSTAMYLSQSLDINGTTNAPQGFVLAAVLHP